MVFLYNIFIQLYKLFIQVAAIRNKKATSWLKGRKNLFVELKNQINPEFSYIWIHSASAGEFEQAKPVIEGLKQYYPYYKILISFFSPSGYEAGKKYKKADALIFLPLDTDENARKFLQLVNPKLVIFVKYDYWYHHLKTIRQNNIPLLLISSIFRENQPFFRFYGRLHKKMLLFFTWIFVQDLRSLELLKTIHIYHSSVSGDTRFDRVNDIQNQEKKFPTIVEFINNKKIIVAGSTWPEDEQLFSELMIEKNDDIKLIIAPHEINVHHIKSILSNFKNAIQYSKAIDNISSYSTLIIDNVGMLSQLYKYATITYVGGGFNKSGIHNTLEAAVWGKPVLFGPNFQKFKEARDLVKLKAGFSVSTPGELKNKIISLLNDESNLFHSGNAAFDYIQENKGATKLILNYIQENRLLTN